MTIHTTLWSFPKKTLREYSTHELKQLLKYFDIKGTYNKTRALQVLTITDLYNEYHSSCNRIQIKYRDLFYYIDTPDRNTISITKTVETKMYELYERETYVSSETLIYDISKSVWMGGAPIIYVNPNIRPIVKILELRYIYQQGTFLVNRNIILKDIFTYIINYYINALDLQDSYQFL